MNDLLAKSHELEQRINTYPAEGRDEREFFDAMGTSLRELASEIATLRNKIERQDAALELLSERAEAAESAVDVLEKQAAGVTEEASRHRSIVASVWDYLRSRDVLPPREGSEHDRIMIGLGTIERRLTAQLAAERERCAGLEGKFFRDVVCGRNCTCVGKPAEEMCLPEVTLTEVIAFFRALPAPEAT